MPSYSDQISFLALVESIARRAGIPSDEARSYLAPLLEKASSAISVGETIRLGSLGTFVPGPYGIIGFTPGKPGETDDPGAFEIDPDGTDDAGPSKINPDARGGTDDPGAFEINPGTLGGTDDPGAFEINPGTLGGADDPGALDVPRTSQAFVDVVFTQAVKQLVQGNSVKIEDFGILTPLPGARVVFTPAGNPADFMHGYVLPDTHLDINTPAEGWNSESVDQSDPDNRTEDPGAQLTADD